MEAKKNKSREDREKLDENISYLVQLDRFILDHGPEKTFASIQASLRNAMFGDNKENLGELQLCLSKGYDNYDWAQRILFELDGNSMKRGKHYIQMSLNNVKIDMDSKNIYI